MFLTSKPLSSTRSKSPGFLLIEVTLPWEEHDLMIPPQWLRETNRQHLGIRWAGRSESTLLPSQLTYLDICAHSGVGRANLKWGCPLFQSMLQPFCRRHHNNPSVSARLHSLHFPSVSRSLCECRLLLASTPLALHLLMTWVSLCSPRWKPGLLWAPRWTGPECLCHPYG